MNLIAFFAMYLCVGNAATNEVRNSKRYFEQKLAQYILGLCLGWKGQLICWREGREGRGRGGEREGGERGRVREIEGGWGEREGGREGRGGEGKGGEGRGGEGRGGEGRGGMTVIHIVIGMFTSNPMIPQYLNNNLT